MNAVGVFVYVQYAVRGELFLKAAELQAKGKEIIFTNGAHSTAVPACTQTHSSSCTWQMTGDVRCFYSPMYHRGFSCMWL